MNFKEFSNYFDHTYLKNDMNINKLQEIISEAKEYGFFSICIPPFYVKKAKELAPEINITTVIDFPLGYSTLESKISQIKSSLDDGADEFDIVIAPLIIKNKDYELYKKIIFSVKEVIGSKILKVIIETSLLTDDEIITVSKICESAKADFIKTSTGFGTRGASIKDIDLIKTAAPNTKIKASGGIKTLADALNFIDLGVSRIGSSNSVEILKSFNISQ